MPSITLPKGKKAIRVKCVFKIKRDGNDALESYKTRLVAKITSKIKAFIRKRFFLWLID